MRRVLEKLIEGERARAATNPGEQIARWAAEAEKARAKRARYQD